MRMRLLAQCLLIALLLPAPWAAFAQDHYFDSNGTRIRYAVQGAGAPVVLVHGYTGAIE